MGGMIAQVMAVARPDRVRSLTSIMSTTGKRTVGWQHPRLLPMLIAPRRRGREAYDATQLRTGELIGAPAARVAIDHFFNAVKAQDIQAMSTIFGTSNGPARDQIDRAELEKRMMIMQCYFNHDKFRVTGESSQGAKRVYQLERTRGTRTRNTSAVAVHGPSDRWYIESLDIAAVRDFCAEPKQ
jgi:hypothetical protein